MRFSRLFFRLVHQNCLSFGTSVNLGNTYILEVFILFEQFLIPYNPLYLLKRAKQCGFSTFLQIGSKLFSVERIPHLENLFRGKKFVFLIFSYYNIQEICRETQHRALVVLMANFQYIFLLDFMPYFLENIKDLVF